MNGFFIAMENIHGVKKLIFELSKFSGKAFNEKEHIEQLIKIVNQYSNVQSEENLNAVRAIVTMYYTGKLKQILE